MLITDQIYYYSICSRTRREKKKLKIAIEQRYYSLFFRKGREFLWKMFGTN